MLIPCFTSPYFLFQSTHSRGVRLCFVFQVSERLDFNPRTHEECDPEKFSSSRFGVLVFQSTHSRGVRHPDVSVKTFAFQFQSTHSRGVRHVFQVLPVVHVLFQSTHSRGVRLALHYLCVSNLYHFNPRTHEECDIS